MIIIIIILNIKKIRHIMMVIIIIILDTKKMKIIMKQVIYVFLIFFYVLKCKII